MALAAIKITVGQSLGEGRYSTSPSGASVPASGTLTTDVAALVAAKVVTTTVASDVATLVSHNVAVTPVENAVATLELDGATPTQAHVTTLRGVWDTLSAACTTHNGDANTVNTHWGTLATACTALNAAVDTVNTDAAGITTAISGNVLVQWDTTVVTHRNQVRAGLRRALEMIEAGYGGLAE